MGTPYLKRVNTPVLSTLRTSFPPVVVTTIPPLFPPLCQPRDEERDQREGCHYSCGPARAGRPTHQRAPLLLGVQKQPVTDAAKAFITIKRIICRRGKSLPHNVAKGESEKNWDEARSRSQYVETGISIPIILLTLLLFVTQPFLFHHLCLAPQLLSNLNQSLQPAVGLNESVSSHRQMSTNPDTHFSRYLSNVIQSFAYTST